MHLLEWTPIDGEQLTAAIRKNRRELRELGRTGSIEHRESTQQAIDDAVELAVDGVDVPAWPGSTASAFVLALSRLGNSSVERDPATQTADDKSTSETLQRIADLLLAVSISAANSIEADVKAEVSRFWIACRLMQGIAPQDSQAFISAATEVLRPIAAEPTQVVAEVQQQVLAALMRQFSAPSPTPAPPVAETEVERTTYSAPPPTTEMPDAEETTASQGRDAEVEEPQQELRESTSASAEPSESNDPAPDTLATSTDEEVDKITPSNPSEPLSPSPTPLAPPIARIRFWNHLYSSEADVIAKFPQTIDDVIALGGPLGDAVRKQVDFLANTKRQYERWMDEGQQPGRYADFMGPAIQNAQEVSVRLLHANQVRDAFRISNTWAEICKMLLPRNRHVYENKFEGLLLIASRAVAQSHVPSAERSPSQAAAEIEPLLKDLGNVVRSALGTYFRQAEKLFARGRVDADLTERIVNEVVAEYFNKRLRHLLEANRPQVGDFVRNNMPAVYRLRLPAEWANKKQEWERLLEETGYAAVLKVLRGMGDLVDPDEVGKVPAAVRDEVSRAANSDDGLQIPYAPLQDASTRWHPRARADSYVRSTRCGVRVHPEPTCGGASRPVWSARR